MYGVEKKNLFIDLAYEITVNTLGDQGTSRTCENDMDTNFDDCLMEKANERLIKKWDCTVPYIPLFNTRQKICDPNEEVKLKKYLGKRN